MNKNKIRNFSIYSRNILLEVLNGNSKYDSLVIEDVAYTWFSRLITIYFLEVNNYQPYGDKVVLSSLTDNVFKLRFIDVCNKMNLIMPEMFEEVSEIEKELFPFSLSNHEGVVFKLLNDIPKEYLDIESDNGIGQVEILGWMHQYYNTDKKNEVIDVIKKHRIKKEDIPYATQLFTTDWVVEFMVDNSLGRYWLERNPNSTIKTSLKYLMPDEIDIIDEKIKVEDLKIIDNAMGSGHILTYAFDVLMQIYLSEGYSRSDAAVLIIENNLYGLEIDKSSYQLAYFSLMMKVRQNNPQAFESALSNNLEVFIESKNINLNNFDLMGLKMEEALREKAISEVNYLIDTYKNAKEIGSLLIVKEVDADLLKMFIEDYDNDVIVSHDFKNVQNKIFKLIKLNKMLTAKYDVTITNPPYLNKYSPELKSYLDYNYKDYKKDLFSAFMYKNLQLCKKGGYAAYMTPFVWMFINSYAKLRKYIIEHKHISALVQMEYSAFDDATVPICTFVLKNDKSNSQGSYIKLSDFTGRMNSQKIKTLEAINDPGVSYFYQSDQKQYKKIAGNPIAYWSSQNIIDVFEKGERLETILDARQGMATGSNKIYLRYWWEVDFKDIVFDVNSFESYQESFSGKYVPYNKGGQKRQWYGNYDYVIKFDQDNYQKLLKSGNHLPSRTYYFREAITWGLITSGEFSIRYRQAGSVHDVSGMSAFSDNPETLKYILGLLSTPIANIIFKKLNPTLNLQVGDFKNFPVIKGDNVDEVVLLAEENIRLAKADWDLWETSWDFESHFLINNNKNFISIEEAYEDSKVMINNRFKKLKNNQEILNKIFIKIYNLSDKVSFKVKDKDITMTKIIDHKEDIYSDIKGNWYIKTKKDVIESFISFAIGCMFNRYSHSNGESTSTPIIDNKLILSKDDIVKRFIDLLSAVYGEDSLEENLNFIAMALNKRGSAREIISDYLINDFYSYHLWLYKKRPIYLINNASIPTISYTHFNKDV